MKKMMLGILGIATLVGLAGVIEEQPTYASEITSPLSAPKIEDYYFNPEEVEIDSVVVVKDGINYSIVDGQFVKANNQDITFPKLRAYTDTFTLKNGQVWTDLYSISGGARVYFKTNLVGTNALRSREQVVRNAATGAVVASSTALGNPSGQYFTVKSSGQYRFYVTNTDVTTTYTSSISWSY
jgi:hypothetical protein